MDTVGIICSIIAVLAGIITVIFSFLMWRDSKRHILKKIEKKELEISNLQNSLYRMYGASYSGRGPLDPLELEKRKLQSEVDYLKKLL